MCRAESWPLLNKNCSSRICFTPNNLYPCCKTSSVLHQSIQVHITWFTQNRVLKTEDICSLYLYCSRDHCKHFSYQKLDLPYHPKQDISLSLTVMRQTKTIWAPQCSEKPTYPFQCCNLKTGFELYTQMCIPCIVNKAIHSPEHKNKIHQLKMSAVMVITLFWSWSHLMSSLLHKLNEFS